MKQKTSKENEKQIQTFLENVVLLRKRSHLSKTEMAKIMGIGTQSLKK